MKVMKDILVKLMFNILKIHILHNDLLFLFESIKTKKVFKNCIKLA